VKLGFMGFFTKAVRPRAEGNPGGQRRDRRHRHHLQELRPHRRRRRHRQGPRRAGGARCRPDVDRRIEKEIGRLGKRARDGKLSMADMQGGTFTISNGGVYGSLMSTPILNAPQSGILGMHKIQDRPVVVAARSSSAR
jgi:2-oxoglutarate dehydrogenase E2 component (dihydrolipoamide succinyltransferase)